MQKLKLKTVCLVALLSILLPLVISCGGTHSDETQDNGEDSTETVINDTQIEYIPLPEVNTDNLEWNKYGGATFGVLISDKNDGEDIFATNTSDTYSRLSASRNKKICEALDIKTTGIEKANPTEYLKNASLSGDAPDLVYLSGKDGMSDLMLYGLLEDLYGYRDMNFTPVGVSVSLIQQLSVEGRIYMLTGAPVRSSVESTVGCAYDTALLKMLGYEEGFLEEKVKEGAWTLDALAVLSKEALLYESGIRLGAVSGSEDSLYHIWRGLGALTVEKHAGDTPDIAIYSQKNLYYFREVCDFSDEIGIDTKEYENSLFYMGTLKDIEKKCVGRFGILPMPNYNGGQEYICSVDFKNAYFTAISKDAKNKSMSIDFLLAFYTLDLDGVYGDTIEKNEHLSEDMLDIVLKCRYFDFLEMYGIEHIITTAFYSDTADFDSLLSARARFAREALEIALAKSDR